MSEYRTGAEGIPLSRLDFEQRLILDTDRADKEYWSGLHLVVDTTRPCPVPDWVTATAEIRTALASGWSDSGDFTSVNWDFADVCAGHPACPVDWAEGIAESIERASEDADAEVASPGGIISLLGNRYLPHDVLRRIYASRDSLDYHPWIHPSELDTAVLENVHAPADMVAGAIQHHAQELREDISNVNSSIIILAVGHPNADPVEVNRFVAAFAEKMANRPSWILPENRLRQVDEVAAFCEDSPEGLITPDTRQVLEQAQIQLETDVIVTAASR